MVNLHNIRLGNVFLDIKPKISDKKIDKSDFIKTKTFVPQRTPQRKRKDKTHRIGVLQKHVPENWLHLEYKQNYVNAENTTEYKI